MCLARTAQLTLALGRTSAVQAGSTPRFLPLLRCADKRSRAVGLRSLEGDACGRRP